MLSEKIIITLPPRSTEFTSPEVGHRNLHLRSSMGGTRANTQNTFVYYGQISLVKVGTDLCLFSNRFPM